MKNGLSGVEGVVPAQPADRVIGEVFTEVIALFGRLGRQYTCRVTYQIRLVLGCLAGQETVEILETDLAGPVVERTRGGGLDGGGVVPFAPRRGGIAVVLEHLGDQRTALRDLPGVPVPVVGQLGDLAIADAVMVAASQQRRARGRTHRRGVKPVVADTFSKDPAQRVGAHLPAERRRQPRPGVVDQHDQDVGRILGQPTSTHPLRINRLLHRPARAAR